MYILKLLPLALAAAADTGASSADPCFADSTNTFHVTLDAAAAWTMLECGATPSPVLALTKGVTYTFSQAAPENWEAGPLAFGTEPDTPDDGMVTYYANGAEVDASTYEESFGASQEHWLAAAATLAPSTQEEDAGEDEGEDSGEESDSGEDEGEDSGEDEGEDSAEESDTGEDESEDSGEESDTGEDESEDSGEESDTGEDESEDSGESDSGEDESEDSGEEKDSGEDEGEDTGEESDSGEADEGEDSGEDEGEDSGEESDSGEDGKDEEEDAGEDEEEDTNEDQDEDRRLQAAAGYSVTLTVTDGGTDGDLFYMSNVENMAGRIKVYEDGAPLHAEDTDRKSVV